MRPFTLPFCSISILTEQSNGPKDSRHFRPTSLCKIFYICGSTTTQNWYVPADECLILINDFIVEIVDYEYFRSSVLTPENYTAEAKRHYDYGYPPKQYPHYMTIFLSLQKICKKQTLIIERGLDQEALAMAFRAFPYLRELTMHFCVTMGTTSWLELYVDLAVSVTEKSYAHHLQVILDASCARSRWGLSQVNAIHLLGLQVQNGQHFDISELMSLSASLRELMSSTRVFKVTRSDSALDLLSHCELNIEQFDMCETMVNYRTLKRLLTTNRKSICSIGFHNVLVSGMPLQDQTLPFLNVDLLCQLIDSQEGMQGQEAYCHCCSQQKCWRLLVSPCI
jgi:hypothetical protein